ncbi:MAG TPA: CBS domain-containing protein, partial [Chromatiales bacterium]|nr:CBS domain-containing protein [Chromatiales bacterium]HEX22954.1 CBS domain-containing protein [Chromatiales bacterium]
VDSEDHVAGIFTDGDLRRVLDHGEVNVREMSVAEAMTRDCQTVTSGRLAVEVLHLMEQHKINALLVVDGNGKLVGALNMHDLLRAGVV